MTTEEVLALFAKEKPKQYTVRNTSHGEDDFREVILDERKPGVLPEQYHDRIHKCLDETEYMQTREIDFAGTMH